MGKSRGKRETRSDYPLGKNTDLDSQIEHSDDVESRENSSASGDESPTFSQSIAAGVKNFFAGAKKLLENKVETDSDSMGSVNSEVEIRQIHQSVDAEVDSRVMQSQSGKESTLEDGPNRVINSGEKNQNSDARGDEERTGFTVVSNNTNEKNTDSVTTNYSNERGIGEHREQSETNADNESQNNPSDVDKSTQQDKHGDANPKGQVVVRINTSADPEYKLQREEALGTTFEKLENATEQTEHEQLKVIDGRYVFGEENGTFRQIPYPAIEDSKKFHKPDLIADISQIDNLLVMGASLRGESHYADERVRQDSFSIENFSIAGKHYIMAAIADGVGNAVYSDQLADLLVNNIGIGIKEQLNKAKELNGIDWEYVASYIWHVSVEFCKRQSNGSEDLNDYYGKWASTLELVVVDASNDENNEFVQVTISGDGGTYLISNKEWYAIKHGKRVAQGEYISNDVSCLPDRPSKPVIKRHGFLKPEEMLFMTTDGLGDGIEESASFREWFGIKLIESKNLASFLAVMCTAISQLDDDKTGILVKHYKVGDNSEDRSWGN